MVGQICCFFLFVFFLCVWEVKSEIPDKCKKDFFNIYTHVAFQAREAVDDPVSANEIKYFLFTRNNSENYTEIDPSNPGKVINKNVRIVFIIHGWIENRKRQWYEDLKNAFLLKHEEYYVIQVDWSEPAQQIYSVSSYNTKDVGNFIGKFIASLHQNHSIPLENFLLVGHSLGGQVSGFVGKIVQKLLNKKLPRIIALDPAGPLFTNRPEEERLNRNDAEVVQVIHTDGGTFGFRKSCGTIDFFPNGGSSQPGCTKIDLMDLSSVSELVACDHYRSWQYFIEAILNPEEFLSTRCDSYFKYKALGCREAQIPMGDVEIKTSGDFYLETNSEKPYGKKSKGGKTVLPSLSL